MLLVHSSVHLAGLPDLAGRHSTVFFIATDQGKLFKIVKDNTESDARHVLSMMAVEVDFRV